MRRFFYAISTEPSNINKSVDSNSVHYPKLSSVAIGSSFNLTETITHHWCRVLRANIGDKGILFDGFGGEYQVELQAISKKQATALLLSYNQDNRTAPIITKIGLVMSRGERMDYAIQKSTELGVSAIQLLTSHRGEVNLKPAQVDKKLEHWQQVAIAACEQCGLNRPPLILAPLSINEWLHTIKVQVSKTMAVSSIVTTLSQDHYYQALHNPADIRLIMSVPSAEQPLIPARLTSIVAQLLPYVELLIGPEGGFSFEERIQAEQVGFLPWQIGNRVLRTETAPVVALASLQMLRHC